MQSAKEMESAEGYALGKLFSKLLQTNEEQARYIIELNKKYESLESEVNEMRAEMTQLKSGKEK